MSTEAYNLCPDKESNQIKQSVFTLPDSFQATLKSHIHGPNLDRLTDTKQNVHETVANFAYGMLPEEALAIAPYAHIAELVNHDSLGRNIRRALHESIFMNDNYTEEQKLYIAAIISDMAEIASYAKDAAKKPGAHFDLASLAKTVESINIESVILKSALDYSNFQLLDTKDALTTKEIGKMERVVASKRFIDTILLEVLGFDALSAEMLSRVYEHDLKQSNNEDFIVHAKEFFTHLGGRDKLGKVTDEFIGKLFSHDDTLQYEVTQNQAEYGMHFTDGLVKINKDNETLSYRTLTRLKSTGATAVKMRNSAQRHHSGEIQPPADIIGITFIARSREDIKELLEHTLNELSKQENIHYVSAPGRDELVHIKGSQDFIDTITEHSSVFTDRNLTVKPEPCTNGYEAGKVTIIYDGCPIEMQFTHETSREASRRGLASHTLFKLKKLLGIDTDASLSDKDIISILEDTGNRKNDFSPDSLAIVPASKQRAERLIQQCEREAKLREPRQLGATALHIVR